MRAAAEDAILSALFTGGGAHRDERDELPARMSGPVPAKPRKHDRPLCGARCRSRGGEPCVARVVCLRDPVSGVVILRRRCRMHGGLSTGARTQAGRDRIAEVQRARWARWRAERA